MLSYSNNLPTYNTLPWSIPRTVFCKKIGKNLLQKGDSSIFGYFTKSKLKFHFWHFWYETLSDIGQNMWLTPFCKSLIVWKKIGTPSTPLALHSGHDSPSMSTEIHLGRRARRNFVPFCKVHLLVTRFMFLNFKNTSTSPFAIINTRTVFSNERKA